jgi:hypothetical protein
MPIRKASVPPDMPSLRQAPRSRFPASPTARTPDDAARFLLLHALPLVR